MVFDAHSDIWSDITVKSLRGESDIFRKYHYDRLQKGGVEGSIFVMWIDPPYDKEPDKRLGQIMEAIRKEILSCQDILRIVHNAEEMQEAREKKLFYTFIGCEGISGIGEDIGRIDELFEFGVRHISLTWNEQNAFAAGIRADAECGLTPLGQKALRKIQQMPILFDVSHLNDKSFWDVMSNAAAPVVATHSNSRSLCPVPRNLTDDMIKAIAATGGMIGVNAYPEFVSGHKDERTVDMLVRHIGHIAELAGIEHVGFGFDFCEFLEDEASASCSLGNRLMGQEQHERQAQASAQKSDGADAAWTEPSGLAGICGLRDASEISNVVLAMRKAGFCEEDIRKVSYENWHKMIQKIMRENKKI